MRILQINNQHYLMGGAHRVYFNTATLLEEHGHQVFFYSMKDENMEPYENAKNFPAGINFRKLSTLSKLIATKRFIYNTDASEKLLDYIDLVKPDVAHVHLFMGGLTTSILQGLKKRKIPIVHTVHDYRLICPAYLFLDGKGKICEMCKDKFYLRCLLKRCSENNLAQSAMLAMEAYFRKYIADPLNYLDRFIFVSQFIKNKHVEFNANYALKSEVLYNFSPNLNTISPHEEKGKYFLYLGRVSREKGLHTLVESVLATGIHLKIVGTGPLMEQYANMNVENIEFLGYKSGNELWDIVSKASFVIVPSEWYENNPLAIIEAYSYGKPVIGANIGGISEIINDCKTGFLFDSGNKESLVAVIQKADKVNNEEYVQMSRSARLFAENNFNPSNYYEELIRIYRGVIKSELI